MSFFDLLSKIMKKPLFGENCIYERNTRFSKKFSIDKLLMKTIVLAIVIFVPDF